MVTNWQEPIFNFVAKKLAFVRNQPLSTFSLCCILGDAGYVLNGKVGSLFDLGLGTIHPSSVLTLGGIMAVIGHIILLAAADRIDQSGGEQGLVASILARCRHFAQIITLGWRPANPMLLGFAALSLNGLALILDALWELMFFGATPVMLLQLVNGVVITLGLGTAMLSRSMRDQNQRDQLNLFSPKILAYATSITFILGITALAPFMLINALVFTIGNSAQHAYALRVKAMENQAQPQAT